MNNPVNNAKNIIVNLFARMKIMKKLILIALTGIVLISCVLISSFAAGSASAPSAAYTEAAENAEEKVFILRSGRGRLIVYRKGEDEPFLVTDALVNNLPRADKLKLEQGIEVKGEDNLRRAIEDYCS